MANILAVDDNPDLCILLKTALERDGHRVVTCSSGADLTEALCRWSDCILLDVMMPNESGFAVCRRIREQTDAPILFLTARTDEASVLERSGVSFDMTGKSASYAEKELPLTRSEYAICEYLALHAGQTFTKEQIYEAVFGVDGTADDTAITQHIKNIRVKLRAAGAPETLLKTVWGVGYQWKSEN